MLEDAFEEADESVSGLLHSALEFMVDDLPPMVHARIAPDGFDPWREAFRIIQAHEVWQSFGAFVTRHQPPMGPGIRERMDAAAAIGAGELAGARTLHAEARDHIRGIVRPGTVLALPTAPCIAPRLDHTPAELEHFRVRVMRLTCTAGLAGLPQVTLPIGTVDGCPVGLSLIGWQGGDEALLDLACALSRTLRDGGVMHFML